MGFANAIYIEGGSAPIEAPDTIQQHLIGTRMILEDGRVFVYAEASGAITNTQHAVKNKIQQGVAQRSLGVQAEIGDMSVTFTTVTPDGIYGDGRIVKDEFVGGYILFFGTSNTTKHIRRITGNTATPTAAAGVITIAFDRGLELVLATTSDALEVIHSPYKGVGTSTRVSYPVVGVPSCVCTDGQFLWIQTWGVCWLALQSAAGVAGETGLVFRHDGSLDIQYQTVGDYVTSQYAGHVISGLTNEAQAAPFFMLQLAP